jgi:hypothetical protein
MPEVDDVSLEKFSTLIGDRFAVHSNEAGELAVTLSEASALSDRPSPTGRIPFSILFDGPPEPILPQRIYPLEHPLLGRLELFLVPLQPESGRARYQAIFT